MKVVSVPLRLQIGAGLLLLAVPLVAFHVALVQRAPWWRLPLEDMGIAGGVVFLLLLPITFLMSRGRQWALHTTVILSGIWIALSGVLAIEARNPALGFFTVFLISFATTVLFWISKEMNRSYFNPGAEWFQGLPESIPEISCKIGFGGIAGGSETEQFWKQCRVARMDDEGAFVFCEQAVFGRDSLPVLRKSAKVEMIFSHKECQLRCQGKPIRLLHQNQGVGIRFTGLTPDISKELGDWVERLRGKGYVD